METIAGKRKSQGSNRRLRGRDKHDPPDFSVAQERDPPALMTSQTHASTQITSTPSTTRATGRAFSMRSLSASNISPRFASSEIDFSAAAQSRSFPASLRRMPRNRRLTRSLAACQNPMYGSVTARMRPAARSSYIWRMPGGTSARCSSKPRRLRSAGRHHRARPSATFLRTVSSYTSPDASCSTHAHTASRSSFGRRPTPSVIA